MNSVIEISSDEESGDDIQITNVVEIPKETNKTEAELQFIGARDVLVCFGMVRAAVHLQRPLLKPLLVQMNLDIQPGQSHFSISFSIKRWTFQICQHDIKLFSI
jgi:hypothetical protein